MRKWNSGLLASLLTALALAVAVAPIATDQAAAQQAVVQQGSAQPGGARASAIVVLDGSNSMNARLPNDKQFKNVTVREALRASLPGVTAGTEIGLAAFGARRPSDCTDAEVIVPPTADIGDVVGALDRYQARGFSPVVLAMRTAAKALPPGASKAGIILVLDDLASCRGEDPCVVAGELKKQNPALSIHVVGLALKRPDAQVLGCIARQTGGQLIEAADGPAVAPAIAQALRLVSLDQPAPALAVRPTAAVNPTQQSLVGRAPNEPRASTGALIDETQPGVHLTARLSEGKPVLSLPVRWRVFPAGPSGAGSDGGSEALLDRVAPALTMRLAEGRYVVEASTGLIRVRRPFEVTSQGATPVPVVLDAALLRIAARLVKGGEFARDAVLTVSGGGDSQDQRLAPLWVVREGATDLVVPAGAYRIKAVAGLAAGERAVALSAGLITDVDVDLAAGRLVTEEAGGLVTAAGSASAGPPQILVEAEDPDSAAGRREVHRATVARLDLTLPTGSYLVTLRRGAAEVRERFVVRAGETVSRAMALPVARVRLVGRVAAGLPPGLELNYRIERMEGVPRVIERWGEVEPLIDLTPGRYRFEARIGGQNAIASREAEIKGGFEHRIELDPLAAGVQLKLAGARTGLGLGDVYWQIVDERGETVWRTVEAEPQLALGAGRYRVRAEVKDREFERAIEVRAGESRVFEVGG